MEKNQLTVRKEKFEKLKELGVEVYPYEFEKSHKFAEIIAEYKDVPSEDLEKTEKEICSAGRITAIRKMGKSAFIHFFDGEEKLQIYIRKDMVSELDFSVYKLLDIGDIIGVKGRVFKTKSGELTILTSKLTFLTKSFHPLPEKWHGLQDKELRYRQRYLDLIVNDKSRKTFKLRSKLIQEIRMFFYEQGYDEVETPMMHPIPGGAAAKPFVTHHNALDIDLYLRIAPELYLKRLLVGGMEKIFELNRNFRNEGLDMNHNPEFTMIEWYQLYNNFTANMDLTEKIFARLNKALLGNDTIEWNGETINLAPPFKKRKYMDLISENCGLSTEELWDEKTVHDFIKKNLPQEECPPTFGKQLDLLFECYAEEKLKEPVFVTHQPKLISPLAKESRENMQETERFELFIAGMEIANGFSELNDPFDQKKRFEDQLKDREKGDDEAHIIDSDFITALEQGMAPATGEGMGIDRLVMLYSGASSIKEVILFPQLRPKS